MPGRGVIAAFSHTGRASVTPGSSGTSRVSQPTFNAGTYMPGVSGPFHPATSAHTHMALHPVRQQLPDTRQE